MSTNAVTVLDLGSSKVTCISAEQTESGRMRILAFASSECKGVKKGNIVDLDETARVIDEVVRQVQTEAGYSVKSLVVGIGGQSVEGHLSQGFVPIYPRTRAITRDDLLQVVNHSRQIMLPPDSEQILTIPREFRIDGQRGVKKPIGMSGGRLEVSTMILSAQLPHIQNIERALQMYDRVVDRFIPKSLAAAMSVLTKEQMEHGAALVDIGAGTAEIAVFQNSAIAYHASIPIGGALVTSDVSKLLKTSPEEAEALKLEWGTADPDSVENEEVVSVMQLGQIHPRELKRRILAEIVESRVRELARMSRQQIEKSGHFGMLPGGIVLTGGGSQLHGIQESFQRVFQHMRVQIQAPLVSGQKEKTYATPANASAIGLVKFELEAQSDEYAPVQTAATNENWKDKIRTILSLKGVKA